MSSHPGPYGLNCRREQLKIGNHAKQRTVRDVQCARCLSSGHGNPYGKLIVKQFLVSVLCAGGGTPPLHAPLLNYACNVVRVFTQSPPPQNF